IIGILALTFPFAAWPIISWLRRNVKEHLVVQAKISKIEKYDRNKKTLLLLAFSTGENRIRLGNSVEIAELIADGVLEGYSFNFNVQYEVWNYLNAAPAKRDTILEHHDLIETVKHVIRKINDQKTYY
ncbi:hypothetical protein, partial [Aquidulcibacter sp.]|uniref:hypothetical protein n=1 Tax=Aquidulcibacter sp. TaxID=2052990 RepID=UPI0025BBFCEA